MWGSAQLDLYESDALIDLARGPKGAGKTRVAMFKFLTWAVRKHNNRELVIACPSLTQWRDAVLPEVRLWSRMSGVPWNDTGSGFRVRDNSFIRVIARKDYRMVGRVKSLNLVGAYLLEFNEMPQDVVDEIVFSRVRITKDRKVILDYNPAGTKHWAETEYWDRADELGIRTHQFSLDDNPGLDPEWVRLQYLKYPEGTHQHNRYVIGIPSDAEGRVWKHITTVPKVPTGVPKALFVGVDAGQSKDHPHHSVLFAEYPTGVFAIDEYRYPSSDDDPPLTEAQQTQAMMSQFRKWGKVQAYAVDPAALNTKHEISQRGGRVVRTSNDRKAGIELCDSLFARRVLQLTPNVPELERECLNWQFAKDSSGIEKERYPEKQDDHGPDATRYAMVWRNNARARAAAKPVRVP